MTETPEPSSEELDRLFADFEGGDRDALTALLPHVLEELRDLASRHLRRERAGHTFQTSALVNEAYLRLAAQRKLRWESRSHFLAIATRLMRRILVDHARERGRAKRGGDRRAVELEESLVVEVGREEELVALDEALARLEARDPRKCRVVELRFFAGLGLEEVAEVLRISPNTVTRDWNLARAWLHRELRPDGATEGEARP